MIPRIKAAVAWIRSNYDLKSNPGMGDAGLYYYYHVFAKTLDTLGGWSFEDIAGVSHDWRSELAEELARSQRDNGSWVNSNNRWMEGDPNLATAYAPFALPSPAAIAKLSIARWLDEPASDKGDSRGVTLGCRSNKESRHTTCSSG